MPQLRRQNGCGGIGVATIPAVGACNVTQPAKSVTALVVSVSVVLPVIACSRDTQAITPDQLNQQYGIAGAYADTIATPEGSMKGTVVPVTLADGRRAQLVIPAARRSERGGTYLRDESGLHPVEVRDDVSPQEIGDRPRIVDHHAATLHRQGPSWEKEALIIGGSAGAGTAIGAIAGGKKGAAVGATAGGIGGLIYDLATRHKS